MTDPTKVTVTPRHRPIGSLRGKWDLHFHTPSSFDYHDKSVSDQHIVDGLVKAGLDLVAITDHHFIDVFFHTSIHRYFVFTPKIALTQIQQLFSLSHVDGRKDWRNKPCQSEVG